MIHLQIATFFEFYFAHMLYFSCVLLAFFKFYPLFLQLSLLSPSFVMFPSRFCTLFYLSPPPFSPTVYGENSNTRHPIAFFISCHLFFPQFVSQESLQSPQFAHMCCASVYCTLRLNMQRQCLSHLIISHNRLCRLIVNIAHFSLLIFNTAYTFYPHLPN